MITLTHSATKSSPKGKTIYMRDIPINLFKGRRPSTFIKFVNLINRLDRDGKGCYAKDAWLARKLEVSTRTITNYFERCRSLGFCSVINSDKRNRLVLGYDSLRKQMKQGEEKSQENDEVKSSEASTDTAKTFCFNPQVVSERNTIENDPKNLNTRRKRRRERRGHWSFAQWILCLIFINRNLWLKSRFKFPELFKISATLPALGQNGILYTSTISKNTQ